MGQQTSKEHDRLNELRELCWKNHRLRLSLGLSDRAVYRAAWLHYEELWKEQDAIWAVLRARREGRFLPMPDPIPPLSLPPLPEPDAAAALALSSAASVEPGTPMGGASVHLGQLDGSSSSIEEGAHACGAERSEVVPLLAAGNERQAPRLRRRQRHAKGS